MGIRGVNFSNQEYRPADHGAVFERALTDGWLTGGGLSVNSPVVTIRKGLFVACGRVFEIDADYAITISATSGYARVKAVINMSGTSTETAFSAVTISYDTAASVDALKTLQKDAVNDAGLIYEVELGIVKLGSTFALEKATGYSVPRAVVPVYDDPGAGASVPYPDGTIVAVINKK